MTRSAISLTVDAAPNAPWIDSEAYNLVRAYAKTDEFLSDPVQVADSSTDAEDMLSDVLDEDTGDADMLAFVEEHGDEGRDALLGAFTGYVEACVEAAESILLEEA